MSIYSKLLQLENTEKSIYSTFFNPVTIYKLEHPKNILSYSIEILLLNYTYIKFLQLQNALLYIIYIWFGMIIYSNPLYYKNEYSPITKTDEENYIFLTFFLFS